MALSPEDAAYIVDQFGIDVERPLLTQVSRFDPWKDPLGVIDAYRLREERVPGGAARARRLDGARRSRRAGSTTTRPSTYAAGDPDIYILSNLNNVGSVEVNAFQVHSAPSIQKSIREGFGPHRQRGALEGAADRRRPRRRHRRRRSTDGETGWLVDSADECAAACLEILRRPGEARGCERCAGKEYVPDATS